MKISLRKCKQCLLCCPAFQSQHDACTHAHTHTGVWYTGTFFTFAVCSFPLGGKTSLTFSLTLKRRLARSLSHQLLK